MLDQIQVPNGPVAEVAQRRHEALRGRPQIIPIEEDLDQSESKDDEGEYHYQPRHQGRHNTTSKSPLSEEVEEMQWPRCFNPTILPPFDGKSDPKEFLLKYEATIEATGGAPHARQRHSSSS